MQVAVNRSVADGYCAALRELPPGERKSLIDYLDYLYYRSERRKKRQD